MSSSRHSEADLFARALAMAPGERESFLKTACAADEPLRQRVMMLLHAHEQPETVLTQMADADLAFRRIAGAGSEDEAVGRMLGRYKLLERLGEGGCGVVYVAEQTEPVRRRVALKVIKLGMDTKQVVARFDAERQALAMMDHPNIAKVFDAGSSESGRPYFVMELVRGIPITQYCDQAQCTTKARLELFIKVCHAIQHAHQKGVIHRDIKPSNILVSVADPGAAGVPKVIDFGIAKATAGRLTDATVYTQLHQFIGTPAYMSPEQTEISPTAAGDIDTRSDIYSLGVLLYELLIGSTPFDADELMASGIDGMRQTICEREPQRPITRLALLSTDQLNTTAKRRSADASKLLHQLKGDLDWIVIKCLEKDRQRRYETANGLAADISRHLNNEPVLARPPSAPYRLRKAIRRNRLVFTAGTVVLLTLVFSFAVTLHLFLRERAVGRELRQERLTGVVDRAMFAAMSADEQSMELALTEARAKEASGGQVSLLKGLQAIVRGDTDNAQLHLREASAAMPDNVAAHALLATAYVYAQRYQDYDVVSAKLSTMKEVTPEDFLFKGQALCFDNWDAGLPLLDRAVALKPSAMAHIIRAESRVIRAWNTGRPADIALALEDVTAAKAKSWSQHHLQLILNSCQANAYAAEIHRKTGDRALWTNYLAAADLDGKRLESFGGNPLAAVWRITQLEMAGREEGPDGSIGFMERLIRDHKVLHPLVQMRYGAALLRRGDVKHGLEILESVPADDWIDSLRLLALVELTERRDRFSFEYTKYRKNYGEGVVDVYSPTFLLHAGFKAEARRQALGFIEHPPSRSDRLRAQYLRVAEYLAGRLSETDFLRAASGVLGDECDAHYAVGMQHLADGDREGAEQHLQKAVDTSVWMWTSHSLSRVALAQLKRNLFWPPH